MCPQASAPHTPGDTPLREPGQNLSRNMPPSDAVNYSSLPTNAAFATHTDAKPISYPASPQAYENSKTHDYKPFNVGGSASVDDRVGRLSEKDLTKQKRERSKTNTTSKSGSRICNSCNQSLTGQFVRALGGTFHLECFLCRDCGQVVASKFFPIEESNGEGPYPLCETDYFRRLDLLCHECGGALRGSYITAVERKYHIEHFTCSVCPTVFGAQDSYYEHEGKVFCHYHYSSFHAQRCNGCQTAILKQFVEIFRNGQNQHWHPECYMIHKFWNVRLAQAEDHHARSLDDEAPTEVRDRLRLEEDNMEVKVYRIWSVLSTFEESSAACISDMLLHVSNGAYMESVMVAQKFICHVDILFSATDALDTRIRSQGMKCLSYGREAKLLCKKIVAFFTLLSRSQESGVRKLGVTQELLSLVTGLAHYLKLLIRISLQGALKLEKEKQSVEGLNQFLDDLSDLDSLKEAEQPLSITLGGSQLAKDQSDLCFKCHDSVDEECVKRGEDRWHKNHILCDYCHVVMGDDIKNALWSEQEQKSICQKCLDKQSFPRDAEHAFVIVSRLQQYVYLLRVALARLLAVLQEGGALPHTSDDPNLAQYDSNDGHRADRNGLLEPPLLRANSRSKSYNGTGIHGTETSTSSYAQTVGEMKRLRSTRMDNHLASNLRTSRASRILDGSQVDTRTQTLSSDDTPSRQYQSGKNAAQAGELRIDAFSSSGRGDGLTLDDIPRIVAAEQAREHRPNAYKHAGQALIGPDNTSPRILSTHQRNVSGANDLDSAGLEANGFRGKRYFSELTALEYFIVRHVAVVCMEPLLEGQFNMEELLNLIETRKPTFWGKFGKAFAKNDREAFEAKVRPKGGKKKGMFGVPLEVLVDREGVESTYGVGPGALRVPGLLDDSISAMRGMDMSVEGVFRKNGNIKGLRNLTEKLDAKADVDLSKESPVQVAALLKKFLRELPDPLMTHKLYHLFIAAQKITDPEKQRRVFHLSCCLLPKIHRDALEILLTFLVWASSFSQVDEESGSKMDIHNLATVIAPNILKEKDTAVLGMDDSSFLAIEAVHCLLKHNEQMCEVPEDLQSILNDPSLHNNPSDITTKEILRRYGDIGRSAGHRPNITEQNIDIKGNTDSKTGPSARVAAPVITHIDNDAYHKPNWPQDSSLRHVAGSGVESTANFSTAVRSPRNTNRFEFGHQDIYHHRVGSTDSQLSFRSAKAYPQPKPSGWGKSNGPDQTGVAS